MIKSQTKLLTLTIMLLLAAILIVSFGCGGDSSGVVPEANVSQTDQTETLVAKDVEGVIYNISNSNKDTEEEDTFTVLPISMEGDEGFLAQVNEYIAENSSSKAFDDDMQELLTAFNEEAENYQPLPSWNSAAGLYGSYADSESSTGLSVGADGSFNGSVLTSADEDVVPLDIIIPDGDVFEVETISSDLLNSSESSEIDLKGCPANIITKPNKVIIFKVFSKPSANLYDAGLEFNLADSEIGVICGPIFIRCGGRKSSVAFGLLYVKRNVSTPFDTAIEVSTAGGQSLSIPVQVVKNTAQVMGTVYDDSPILKGWVKSIGPKSYCKIGADGTYTLPKTYMGTGRKITAKWWTLENGQKVKHMETKYVDLMGDCVVDFGVVPVPRPLWDTFYDERVSEVVFQFELWKGNFGAEEALQMTVDWLNNDLPAAPSIPQEIVGAVLDEHFDSHFWIHFKDDHGVCVNVKSNDLLLQQSNIVSQENLESNSYLPISNSIATTTGSSKILILCPYIIQNQGLGTVEEMTIDPKTGKPEPVPADTFGRRFAHRVYGELAGDLRDEGYDVTWKVTTASDIYFDKPGDWDFDDPTKWVVPVKLNSNGDEFSDQIRFQNIVRPSDFQNLSDYGVIYIATHGIGCFPLSQYYDGEGLQGGYVIQDDPDTQTWVEDNQGTYFYTLTPSINVPAGGNWTYYYEPSTFPNWNTTDPTTGQVIQPYVKHFRFTRAFFQNHNINNAIIYMNACWGWKLNNIFAPGNTYLSYSIRSMAEWSGPLAYNYFYFLMYGFREPVPVPNYTAPGVLIARPEQGKPMTVMEAHDLLSDEDQALPLADYFNMNPDPTIYTVKDAGDFNGVYLNIITNNGDPYFPSLNTDITVSRE